jgi:bifunctional DNA-binding transcriptional regulator/antitoxin component of YhaV-PrlF toxin-antitoxin module
MRALGWEPGGRLDVRESGGLILVTADRQGVFGLTRQGHLRLPVAIRRWCGLATGDRVLLAAEPGDGLLVVHPLAALDAMITQFHAAVLGGDPA